MKFGGTLWHFLTGPANEVGAKADEIDVSIVSFNVEVVGESNYQKALQYLMRRAKHGEREWNMTHVRIQTEPTNTYDPNAVRISSLSDDTIGYLSRDDALKWQPAILALESEGKSIVCDASLFGGTKEKPHIGAWLALRAPRNLSKGTTD